MTGIAFIALAFSLSVVCGERWIRMPIKDDAPGKWHYDNPERLTGKLRISKGIPAWFWSRAYY